MRYVLKLTDLNLPKLTREIAKGCWTAADAISDVRTTARLYRALYRAVRSVLRSEFESYRYCGAKSCHLGHAEFGERPWTEPFPPEAHRVHLFIGAQPVRPTTLVAELVRGAVNAVARVHPGRPWKGLALALRRQVEKSLQGRVYRAETCGQTPLCDVNEPADPWDLNDVINAT
jgi:hypothetical protein